MRLHLLFSSLLLGILPALALPAAPSISDLIHSSQFPTLSDAEAAKLLNISALPSPSPSPSLAKRATIKLDYWAYRIRLNGIGVGNWENFDRTGILLLTSGISSMGTRNGNNPYEVVMYAGDNPAFLPVAGSIRYVSNRYLYKLPVIGGIAGDSRLDFAYVTVSGSTLNLRVDQTQSWYNQRSMFNDRSGPTAQVYQLRSGAMAFTFGAKGVNGWISLIGGGFTSGSIGHPYKAVVTGAPLGKFTITI